LQLKEDGSLEALKAKWWKERSECHDSTVSQSSSKVNEMKKAKIRQILIFNSYKGRIEKCTWFRQCCWYILYIDYRLGNISNHSSV
jgi:hypothetical protein